MLFIILIVPIHEFLHAVIFKGGLTSKRVVFGFYPKVFGFYAYYNGKITRHRYIIIAVFPFLMLTVIPLMVVTLFQVECKYLVEVIFASGMGSGMDILGIIIILRQVPRQSVLISSGMKTYWKPMANKPLELNVG